MSQEMPCRPAEDKFKVRRAKTMLSRPSVSCSEENPYESPQCESSRAVVRDDSEFVLAGCLTVEDAIAAHRLATRGFWPRLTLAVLIFAAFSAVLLAVAMSSRPYSVGASNVFLFVACVFPGVLLAPVVLGRVRLHRLARKQFGMFAPTHSTFSPSGVVTTSRNAKSELQWAFFSHCRANDTVAILFLKNSNGHLILARRKLQCPADWEPFISLIQRQLARCGD
jgi:hypothetical protein